jgi:hypothetical protein
MCIAFHGSESNISAKRIAEREGDWVEFQQRISRK